MRYGVAFMVALSLVPVPAGADTVHLKGGTTFEGTITKTSEDFIDVRIKKTIIDPDDFSVSNSTGAALHAGIIVLKDGSYLHGTVTQADADTVTLQIAKIRLSTIDFATAASTNATAQPEPPQGAAGPIDCPPGESLRFGACHPITPILGGSARQEQAAPKPTETPRRQQTRRAHLLIGFDLYLPKNAADGIKGDLQNALNAAGAAGISSSYDINTTPAYGGRIGCLYDVADSLSIGASLGYIAGPETTGSVFFTSGAQSATLNEDWKSSFTRWMFEMKIGDPSSENTTLVLGAAAGIAWGDFTRTTTCSGSCGTTTNASARWSGLSWEISPAIARRGFLLGVRYAGFPTFNGTPNALSKMSWTTGGVFSSYIF